MSNRKMRGPATSASLVVAIVGLLGLFGCDDSTPGIDALGPDGDTSDAVFDQDTTDLGPTCGVVGGTQACVCTDGDTGSQSCLASGAWGPCVCEGEPLDCVVGEWSNWSACDADCGGGQQTRTRNVLLQPANGGSACPQTVETQACNADPCPSCTDRIQNADEEGVDCGGSCPLACPGLRLDGFSLGGQGESAEIIVGSDLDIELSYAISVPSCQTCLSQLVVFSERYVVNLSDFSSGWVVADAACVYDGLPGDGTPVEGSAIVTLHDFSDGADGPSDTIRYLQTLDFSCSDAIDRLRSEPAGEPRGQALGTLTVTEVPRDFALVHLDSSYCVDVPGSSIDTGVGFIVWGCSGNPNQTFNLRQVGAGQFRVEVAHSSKCFDVTGGESQLSDGAPIQQFECIGGRNQFFELLALRGGYALRAVHSGKCVDAYWSVQDPANPLSQNVCHGYENPYISAQVFALR